MFTPRCKTSHWESAGWPVGQLTSNNCPRVLSSFFRWSWKQKFQSWYSCHLCWMMKPYTAMTRLNEAFRLAAKSRAHRRGLIHQWHKCVEAHDCRHQITSLLPYIPLQSGQLWIIVQNVQVWPTVYYYAWVVVFSVYLCIRLNFKKSVSKSMPTKNVFMKKFLVTSFHNMVLRNKSGHCTQYLIYVCA